MHNYLWFDFDFEDMLANYNSLVGGEIKASEV